MIVFLNRLLFSFCIKGKGVNVIYVAHKLYHLYDTAGLHPVHKQHMRYALMPRMTLATNSTIFYDFLEAEFN